jgi:hypothetical protein
MGGCPSIYTRRRGGAVAIPTMKSMHHHLLHGGMQPPHEGGDERRQQGASCPLTTTTSHSLRVVGRGLDLHCSPVEFCFIWVELIGVFVIALRDSLPESAFRWISHAFYVCDLQTCLHQNLWKVWVKISNSKFGVYLSIFYMKFDGQKLELRTTKKLPHTYPFGRPRAKLSVNGNYEHSILRYMAYISVIPTHSFHKYDMWH